MKLTEDSLNKILSLISINPDLIDKKELSKYELSLEQIEILKDYLEWDTISHKYNENWEFYDRYPNLIDWYIVSISGDLPFDFIQKYEKNLHIECLIQNQKLPEEYLEKIVLGGNFNKIFSICCHQSLPEEFIRKHKDVLSWEAISAYQPLSEDFVEEFLDRIKLANISFRNLSEDFISQHIREINTNNLIHKPLSEEFLQKYISYFKIDDLCNFQKLSEDFIIKNRLCSRLPYQVIRNQNITYNIIIELEQVLDEPWEQISYFSNLTFDVIKNHIDKLNIHHLLQNKNISEEIKDHIKMFA